MRGVACGFNGLPGRAQTGENAANVFITDRHDQRRPVFRIEGLIANRRRGDAVLIAPDKQLQEAHQRRPESG
ncbi:Uncharacterised protein [Salmonella enterica subsp. enterica serovar Bovismorbificans]|uniref:Uncharacterized protein n=1 Tax=Salmonella enterica subsp. enterica serovar Bovismorbificans TaxID=58097 RepID=A0A655ELV7_SALET|nr:Uncharacterised protein [Salmonella enterica subsp. enterica serovar Bovismorbificans]